MKTFELKFLTFSTALFFHFVLVTKKSRRFSSTALSLSKKIIYCQVFQTHSEGHPIHGRLRCGVYRILSLKPW